MKNYGLICLITGADSGLGKAIAKTLAKEGYQLILISNNIEGLRTTRNEILLETVNSEIEIFSVDFSLQRELKLFCAKFKSKYAKLDLLINNAGVNIPGRTVTSEGIEYMFAVNYLAPVLLTSLLMDNLKLSGKARVINIGSNGEKYATLDFENLQGEKSFNSMKQYCLTKLCLLMFTYKLAEILNESGVSVCCVHPGGVRTNIMKKYHWFSIPRITWLLLYPFLKSPDKASEYITSLAAFEPSDVQGFYFSKGKLAKSSQLSLNKELIAKLWDTTLQLLKLN